MSRLQRINRVMNYYLKKGVNKEKVNEVFNRHFDIKKYNILIINKLTNDKLKKNCHKNDKVCHKT